MEVALTELRVGDGAFAADIAAAEEKPYRTGEPQARLGRSQSRAQDVEELLRRPARQNIVWIASYPKSGNTWVRVFLHNLIRELRGKTEGSQDINDLGRFAIWEHGLLDFTRVLGKPSKEATMEEIARARPIVQRLLSAEQLNLALAKTHLC